MSPDKKIEIQQPADKSEGWESLAEEASAGSLQPSAELEEALREAAEAVGGSPASGAQAAAEGDADARPPSEGASEEVALELKQTQDRLLRLQADFENFRRRALKERTEAHQYGHQNLVKDLLSSVDNLERAIEHARNNAGGDLESFLQGVELVRGEFLTALARHGVTVIEALGQPFDPSLHEAMAQMPDASLAPNTVVQEMQKGYKLRDRLIRPSRVVVSRVPDEDESQPQGGQAAEASGEGSAGASGSGEDAA